MTFIAMIRRLGRIEHVEFEAASPTEARDIANREFGTGQFFPKPGRRS